MIQLLPNIGGRPLTILCLGAHCDDIEIGCGATIRKLVTSQEVDVHWHIFSSNPERAIEAKAGAASILEGAHESNVAIQEFRNGYFPYIGSELKDYFERIKTEVNPDIVFTHFRDDSHQDHRMVSKLTWNSFRDHWILEYEIPKYDGDLGKPNVFSPIERELVDFKIDTLIESFGSQQDKPWFDRETFRALMRLRGVECNAESGFAEAFHARKSTINFA